MTQIERKVVVGNRIVEIDLAEEIEIQIGVAGRDPAVEFAVAEPAVEPQRVVDVAVEAQIGDRARDVGIGNAPADHAVDAGRERGVTQQLLASEQFAQPEVARLDPSADRAHAPPEGSHLQRAGDLAHTGGGPQTHVEGREASDEASLEVQTPRIPDHRGLPGFIQWQ